MSVPGFFRHSRTKRVDVETLKQISLARTKRVGVEKLKQIFLTVTAGCLT